MGLIKAVTGAAGGVLADQWREYFYCTSISSDILVAKGEKKTSDKRTSNKKGEDNVISNGSIIAVNEGQFMIIVDGGKIVEFSGDPGEFLYDTSTEASLFYGDLGTNIKATFNQIGKRIAFGGDAPKDQRVYYFNKKEIIGNKYGTVNPVPFRIVDRNIGLDIDSAVRCFGEFSYKIVNPLLFYTNVCGNVDPDFKRNIIESQLKTELLTALQPAFAKISALGVRYSEMPAHTEDLANALNTVLSEKWTNHRGIAIVAFGINSITISEEDQNMIKQLQRSAVMRDPTMAAATIVGAQSEAMVNASKNEGTGPLMAFAGLNMAQQAGGANASDLFEKGQKKNGETDGWKCECGTINQGKFCGGCGKAKPIPMTENKENSWKCECGTVNTGKFCVDCGAKKPVIINNNWKCSCGKENTGKFCADCGSKKPDDLKLKCKKCGWETTDESNPPKFCPECGEIINK